MSHGFIGIGRFGVGLKDVLESSFGEGSYVFKESWSPIRVLKGILIMYLEDDLLW